MSSKLSYDRANWKWLALSLAILVLLAVACGGGEDPTPAPTRGATTQAAATTAPPADAKLSGDIEIDGSSTVFPISQAAAEEFRKEHPDVQIPVGISGTGGGFKRFVVGETDISNASRAIKDSERELAAENGIEFIELTVAFDGLSVIVNPDNDFATCMTTGELKKLWEPGSTVNKWSEIRSDWPNDPIRLYGPDTDSGTFDYFTDAINGEEDASRPDYTQSADDNVLVQGIAGDKNSLGYFGYAYYLENKDKLKLVAVDEGSGCIEPSASTINDGSYSPLSRPMFIYVNKASLERPEVKAFVTFYLENAAVLAEEVGYVALPQADYDEGLALVNDPMGAMDKPADKEPAAPAMKLSGDIEIDGSSTVFPVSQAAAEEFRKEHPDVQIPVGISGTGGGFKRFVVGETDISNASRAIKDSERQLAAENGIQFIELTVAFDGLSVLVNPDNDFATCMTTGELKKLWEPGSTVSKWNEIRSDWPNETIRLYGPDTDSGTFDYFTDAINGEEDASRPDYTQSADDNVLVQGIAGDKNSLGYFGYAYYIENTDKLKLVAVDGGSGCIEPSDSSINDGSYSPLSRPLFIYVNIASLERPEVKAFVEFYLNNAPTLAAEVGYVALPQADYAAGLAAVADPKTAMSKAMDKEPAMPAMKLSGNIEIDGSSTVFPISQAAAEEFRKDHPDVQIPVGISGTGGGFKRFVVGETDISDASRAIKDSERELAAENGIEFIELKVAFDGLSVLVNPDNDFATCMTTGELKKLWEPGSTVSKWSEIRAGWPDQTIRLYGPDTDSGTFDYFTDAINGEEDASRPDYTQSADDNVLVQGIAGDKNSLGYFGYAYYIENTDKLRLVAVDGGSGCVAPSDENINNGTYAPLSRPLFIYVNKASLERPEVKAFVEFYLENADALAAEVGYVALPETDYAAGLSAIR